MLWLAIIGARACNHRGFGLTLGEIIGRVWLTLDDPGLTIIETDLHSSAPGSGLVRRSFAIGGQEKEGVFARQPVPVGERIFRFSTGKKAG